MANSLDLTHLDSFDLLTLAKKGSEEEASAAKAVLTTRADSGSEEAEFLLSLL